MGTPTTFRRLTADELRDTWYSFFRERGHERLPSASLVPENDPTLLFTGAGMNQFKEYFTGRVKPPCSRAMTIQKCFRQGDLENVGRTPRHLTFFEMLGHFSFGDYFKKEAIAWAWEFLTKVLEVPGDRLWVSVYKDDEDARQAWRDIGVPTERIARFDAGENFWPASAPEKGPNGVCGPCSEVYFDYGEAFAKGDGSDNGYDSGRFTEVWNSVFTQYDRVGPGELNDLPQTNIDCGVGYERVLAMIEGQYSVFSTSLFRPIVDAVADLAGTSYPYPESGAMPAGDEPARIRRIADHARAACFLVADGVKPSNEGRGYVLRRVLRRAIRDGIGLGLDDLFLGRLVDPVLGVMGGGHPTVAEGADVIRAVLETEEEQFRRTYNQGMRFLETMTSKKRPGSVLDGETAFKLYDTYGFPVDLAERILSERGIRVDREGFARCMREQQERARAGSKISDSIFAGGPLTDLRAKAVPTTEFLGYDVADGDPSKAESRGVRAQGRVVGLIVDETLVDQAAAGSDVTVILDRSPFYAEAGGQVGDRGEIVTPNLRVEVSDTQAKDGYTLHVGRVLEGGVDTGQPVRMHVDETARDATRRNHTATHLLQAALRMVLGGDVRQEGSLVGPTHLRFDFSHPQAMTDEEIARVERLVNTWILQNDELMTEVMALADAKASGATSLFGEKYGDVVRVVSVDSGSKELCGGTHCRRTGDIGSFRITLETSIAAGVRRIEAVTGLLAVDAAARDRHVVRSLSTTFKVTPDEIVGRVQGLQDELKGLKKAGEKAKRDAGLEAVDRLVATATETGGLKVLSVALAGVDGKALRGIWDGLKQRGIDAALVVGEAGGKAPLLVGLSPAAVDRGLDARALLDAAAAILGGRGGGRPDMAQGQGQDPSRTNEALESVRAAFEATLAGSD